MSITTISVKLDTKRLLDQLKAKKLMSGENVSYDDIIRELLESQDQDISSDKKPAEVKYCKTCGAPLPLGFTGDYCPSCLEKTKGD